MCMSHIGAQIGKQSPQISLLFHPTVESVSREGVAKIIRSRRITGHLAKISFVPTRVKYFR